MEAVECGAAALGIILRYYRRIVPLVELRRECGVSRDGSKASNVLKAARRYGLTAKGFKKNLESVQKLPPPFIVFWNFNHFLVVEGFRKGTVYLNDPAAGPRTVSEREFDEAFTGVVLVMEPGPEFKREGAESSTLLALHNRLRGSEGALLYCVIAGLLLVLPGLAIPVFTQVFVDNVLIQEMQNWLRPLLIGMVMTALLRGLLLRLQLKYLRRLRLKLATVMSARFLRHVLHLPSSFYAQRYAGEVADRVDLNEQVADTLSGKLATTFIDLFTMSFYALVMFQYDVGLTSIGIGFAAINFLALQWISRRRVDANLRLLLEYGKLGGLSVAGIGGMETIKASALESNFFARWAGYQAKALNSQQDLGVTDLRLGLLPPLLSSLTSMLVLVLGGLRVLDGHLSIGMLVAFQSLMQSFLAPVRALVNLGSVLQDLRGNLNRLDDVLGNPTDPETRPRPTVAAVTSASFRLQGTVELKNISFGYDHISPALVQDLSFSLKPGQRVALVGSSGSGKSTIAKLASGLYQPWEGEILLDGRPRSQIPRQVLTHSMALIEQDIMLFGGTARENLSLWDSTLPNNNLVRACKDAEIHDVVSSLPGGLDAKLMEGGGNLSGGQAQRLEIARALVNDPSILIMDEATSALDAETEALIYRNLRRRGCSCIIVAHRLSAIRECDEILVLEQGKVVQRGRHEALVEEDGPYLDLMLSEGGALEQEVDSEEK